MNNLKLSIVLLATLSTSLPLFGADIQKAEAAALQLSSQDVLKLQGHTAHETARKIDAEPDFRVIAERNAGGIAHDAGVRNDDPTTYNVESIDRYAATGKAYVRTLYLVGTLTGFLQQRAHETATPHSKDDILRLGGFMYENIDSIQQTADDYLLKRASDQEKLRAKHKKLTQIDAHNDKLAASAKRAAEAAGKSAAAAAATATSAPAKK